MLKSRELERHLNWYLRSLTKVLEDNALFLTDRPTSAAMRQLEIAPAKSVELGSEITYEQVLPSPTTQDSREIIEAKSVKWNPVGIGANVLECLRENGFIGNLDFEDTLDDANLKVSIEFKYNRKTTKAGQKVLDSLSTSLRHIDKEDVKINLKGGGSIKGDDLKLSHTIPVCFIDGKVDESDLYFKMKDWLNQKVITKEVIPDFNDVIEGSTA